MRHLARLKLAPVLVALALLAPAGSASAEPVTLAGDPAVVSDASGVLNVFGRGSDQHLWFRPYNGGWWPWQDLGSPNGAGIQGRPSVISLTSGHVEVFVRGADNYLWHRFFASGSWSVWHRVGTRQIASDPEVSSWGSGRLDVFARGTAGDGTSPLLHAWWQSDVPGNGWSDLNSLGGDTTGTPAAVSMRPNQISVVIRGVQGHLFEISWFGSGWSQWMYRAQTTIAAGTSPEIVSWGDEQMSVFYQRANNGGMSVVSYYAPYGGWGYEEDLGGVITSQPAAISWQAGHLDAYARGTDGGLYHRGVVNGAWQPWEGLGGQFQGEPAVTDWGWGRVDFVGRGSSGDYVHRAFDGGNGWQPWGSIGDPPDPDTTAPTGVALSGTFKEAGIIFHAPLTLSVAASDPSGIGQVGAYLDGASTPFTTRNGAGDLTIDPSGWSLGPHTVQVRVSDTVGNTATAEDVTVERDIYDEKQDVSTYQPVASGEFGSGDGTLAVNPALRAAVDEPAISSLPTVQVNSSDPVVPKEVHLPTEEDHWLGFSQQLPFAFRVAEFQALPMRHVRLIVEYNVVTEGDKDCAAPQPGALCARLQRVRDWINAQLDPTDPTQRTTRLVDGQPVDILVSFDRILGHRDADLKGNGMKSPNAPTDAEYNTAVEAFMQRFPSVKYYSAWNEPNLPTSPYRPHLKQDDYWFNAVRAGQLYAMLHSKCNAGGTARCIAVAGDFSDTDPAKFGAYLKGYKKGIGMKMSLGDVSVWGIHLHRTAQSRMAGVGDDGNTQNAYSGDPSFLAEFVKATSSSNPPPIWITEVGAITYKPPVCTVVNGKTVCKGGLNHRGEEGLVDWSLWNIFRFAQSHPRIKRVYYYHWRGDENWDSGLHTTLVKDQNGNVVTGPDGLPGPGAPRSIYHTFKKLALIYRYRPRLAAAPDVTQATQMTVTFDAKEQPEEFQCRLDGGSWSACTSPKSYTSLAEGDHTVDVRSVVEVPVGTDSATGTTTMSRAFTGTREATETVDSTTEGTSTSWTVDQTAPETNISSGPSAKTAHTTASIAFTGTDNEAVDGYECRLDGGAWAACTSPKSYTGLAPGAHEAAVRAQDAAGNQDASPATRSWTVDPDFPTNTVAPAISGTPQVGRSVTVGSGTWLGSALTYDYAWQRCDSAGAGCVSAGTGTSYAVALRDLGKRLKVVVTATNVSGSDTATTALSPVVLDYAAVVKADAPESFWRLGEAVGATAAVNSVTGGSAATPYGGTVTTALTFGIEGVLDGNTALTSTGQGRGLLSGGYGPSMDGTWSAEAWVRTTPGWKPAGTSNGALVAKWGAWGVAVLPSGNAGAATYSSSTKLDSGVAVNDGAWHQVVAVVNGTSTGNMTLYVDGVARLTGTWPAASGNSRVSIAAGTDSTLGSTLLDTLSGSVDEISLYNTALTAGQIDAHYDAATTGRPVSTAKPAISGTLQAGMTLTASPGGWSNATAFAYQWYRCSAAGDACAAISGATGSSYKTTGADGDRRLLVVVRATNPYGRTYAASVPTAALKSYSAIIVGDAPESYWRLGEASGATSAANIGTSKVAATPYSSMTGMQFGALGLLAGDTALSVTVPYGYPLIAGQGPALDGTFTAEAWLKTSAGWKPAAGSTGGLTAKYRAWSLSVLDTGNAGTTIGGTGAKVDSGVPVNDGKWHHLAVVINGTTGTNMVLYVDGVARASGAWSAAETTRRIVLATGNDAYAGSSMAEPLVGTLDEVALYDTALPQAKIQSHWLAGSAG